MLHKSTSRQKGFTLIETMVVVTLSAILALMALQFGSHWTNNAKVSRAQSELQHAYSFAKSAALQNNLAVTGNAASATLCVLPNSVIAVVVGGDCASVPAWAVTLDPAVRVAAGTGGVGTCVSLNSAGVPIEAPGCFTALDYSIFAGSANVQNKKLY